MRQTHPSPFSPRSTHTCITRIDLTRLLCLTLRSRPPAAWTSHHLLVQALEWRAARAVEAYASLNTKGEIDASADKRVCRAVTEAFVAGQVSEMIDVLPFGDPTKTIVSSLLRLVRLLFTNYQNLPSHLARTLRQYLPVTIESSLTDLLAFGLRFGSIKLARPDESTLHGGFLVSAWTFFRSLSPSRTHSVSRD